MHAGHQKCGGQDLPESHVWCSKACEPSAKPWKWTNNILLSIKNNILWLSFINEDITLLLLSSLKKTIYFILSEVQDLSTKYWTAVLVSLLTRNTESYNLLSPRLVRVSNDIVHEKVGWVWGNYTIIYCEHSTVTGKKRSDTKTTTNM